MYPAGYIASTHAGSSRMNEFELIRRFFARRSDGAADADASVRLAIGDDCALLAPIEGRDLAVSTDMLVAGRHFFADADPASLGWKTLAVNLSDLAAMGARPLGFTLALALPAVDEGWLAAFSHGLFECADAFGCRLIGGDTTRGPLNLCVTVIGDVEAGRALRRDAARVGDDIWVSGTLGAAALALDRLTDGDDPAPALRAALERPVPRVDLGRALLGVAHAAIDLSDGLAQDLGHVVAASACGAEIVVPALPSSPWLASLDPMRRLRMTLAGGDDYELCFTAPAASRVAVGRAAGATPVTRIGSIVAGTGLRFVDAPGEPTRAWPDDLLRGFDHFA